MQSVRNFFKERGRIRGAVVKLPGKGRTALDWTPMTVCGEVYKDAIKELIRDMTGLTTSNKRGWIAEYPKARAALFHSLSADERKEVETIALMWNRTGIPASKKAA